MSEHFDSLTIRRLRRLCLRGKLCAKREFSTATIEYDSSWANLTGESFQAFLIEKIKSGKPFMLSRFGCGVLSSAIDYALRLSPKTLLEYIFGKIDSLDLQPHTINNVCIGDGFYPPKRDAIMQYGKLICESLFEIDAFATIMKQERFFSEKLSQKVRCRFRDLESFHFSNPWTSALKGKKVLVIHPFVNTIRYQYEHSRDKLFNNFNCLPEFELKLLRAVQDKKISKDSYDQFDTWFDAYDFMCREIDKIDFDIAILGCGGYGMPLASYIKRKGKQAIHLGGGTQYLFGIRSKRADEANAEIVAFYNEYWIRPLPEDTPIGFKQIEGGCYW